MKASSLTLLLAASLPATAETWGNYIRQTQLDSGIIWDMPLATIEGRSSSPLPLEESGALFQLWTLRGSDLQDFILDQKLVGTYLPDAAIRITTSDPYPLAHRTRADQPFTVEVDMNGLLSDPDAPEAAKMAIFEHHLATPDSLSGEITPPDLTAAGTPHQSTVFTENGTFVYEFAATNLAADDPTKARGEEHFVVHALADGSLPQSQLASGHVEVWPVASGAIRGLEEGQEIRFRTPAIELHLDDLYPSSTTYLQIYQGAPALGTVGTAVEGSVLVLDQDSSEDRVIRLSRWLDDISDSGTYTIELIHMTPFGNERLAWRSFQVERSLRINAQIATAEAAPASVITPTP